MTRRPSGVPSKSALSRSLNAKAAQSRTAERVNALSLIYQVERQDKASNVLAGLSLIAAALAYLGIAAILLSDKKLPGGSWTVALLAFPLWIAASFQVLLVWTGLAISKSAQTIEQRLWNSLDLFSEVRSGGRASATGPAFREQPVVIKIQSFICYGGVWAVVISFSSVCLATATGRAGWASGPVIFAAIAYILLLAGNTIAWLYISKFARNLM